MIPIHEFLSTQERWGGFLSEVGVEGVAEEFKDTATLLAAGCDHRPDAFTATLSAFTTGSLRDVTVDHDMPNRLFRLVVRRLDPRHRQEAKVIVRLPYCVLSIVDDPRFKRWVYEVLDHDPATDDIPRFIERFQEALKVRGLRLQGITTDGSALYPEPIRQVFGSGVKHQVCEFHVLQEITKAVLKAVARTRKQLHARKVKSGRGRPSGKKATAAARENKRLQRKVKDLFDPCHLFVKRTLTRKEKRILQRITRGFPSLRALRSIMDQVYRLLDRRRRTETALEKPGRLRARVRRFRSLHETLSKLFSPNVEKALGFLDDSLLPATSNAVERGNRRHRKMQKTVYRVRTGPMISRRIALDMQRDRQAPVRHQTIVTLHRQRRDTG